MYLKPFLQSVQIKYIDLFFLLIIVYLIILNFVTRMDLQKRKINYFQKPGNYQKKRKQFSLESGMTGFLCTCNFHEKDCIRDAYKLLHEFADEIYGSNTTKVKQN